MYIHPRQHFHTQILEIIEHEEGKEESIKPLVIVLSKKHLGFMDTKFTLSKHKMRPVFGRFRKYYSVKLTKIEMDKLKPYNFVFRKFMEYDTRRFFLLPLRKDADLKILREIERLKKSESQTTRRDVFERKYEKEKMKPLNLNYQELCSILEMEFGKAHEKTIYEEILEELSGENISYEEFRKELKSEEVQLKYQKINEKIHKKYHKKVIVSCFYHEWHGRSYVKEYYLLDKIDFSIDGTHKIQNDGKDRTLYEIKKKKFDYEFDFEKVPIIKVYKSQIMKDRLSQVTKDRLSLATPILEAFRSNISLVLHFGNLFKLCYVPSEIIDNLKYICKSIKFVKDVHRNEGNIERFQRTFKMRFYSKLILREALTHKSFSSEFPEVKSNERLEFLGDIVLNFMISTFLFEEFPLLGKTKLIEILNRLTSNSNLIQVGKEMEILDYLLVSEKVRQNLKAEDKPKTYADTIEAIIGAKFLDTEIGGKFFSNFNRQEKSAISGFLILVPFLCKFFNFEPEITKGINRRKLSLQSFEILEYYEVEKQCEIEHIPTEIRERIEKFQDYISIKFGNPFLLLEALTHKSADKIKIQFEGGYEFHFERLSFLGEAIVKLIIGLHFYMKYPSLSEKNYSVMIKYLKNPLIHSRISEHLKLDKYIIHGINKKQISSARKKMEIYIIFAVVGAIYINGGLFEYRFGIRKNPEFGQPGVFEVDVAEGFVHRYILTHFPDTLEEYESPIKTKFQNSINMIPKYVKKKSGNGDQKEVELCIMGETIAVGRGKNIKEASDNAAILGLMFFFPEKKSKILRGRKTGMEIGEIVMTNEEMKKKIRKEVLERKYKPYESEREKVISEKEKSKLEKEKINEFQKQYRDLKKKIQEKKVTREDIPKEIDKIKMDFQSMFRKLREKQYYKNEDERLDVIKKKVEKRIITVKNEETKNVDKGMETKKDVEGKIMEIKNIMKKRERLEDRLVSRRKLDLLGDFTRKEVFCRECNVKVIGNEKYNKHILSKSHLQKQYAQIRENQKLGMRQKLETAKNIFEGGGSKKK